MKTKKPTRFTDLPEDLRGVVGSQLDLKSLIQLKLAAHSTDGSGKNGEPLLADKMVDPLLTAALQNRTICQLTRVARENVNPFTPHAIAQLRKLRSAQHREQLTTTLEAMPAASDQQGRAKALQMIRQFAQIEAASPEQQAALLGGPEEPTILPPIQRLALATNTDTRFAVLARLTRNDTATPDEIVAIVDGGDYGGHSINGPIEHALGEDQRSPLGNLLQQRIVVATEADRTAFLDNPTSPTEVLTLLARSSTKNAERLKILAHSRTDHAVIQALANFALSPKASSLRAAILVHPKVSARPLHTLAKKASDMTERAAIREAALKCNYPLCWYDPEEGGLENYNPLAQLAETATDLEERALLFKQCNGDTQVLGALAKKETRPQLRQQLLTHEKCDDLLLAGLAASVKYVDEFRQILDHPRLGEKALHVLGAKLPFHDLRMLALSHPKISEMNLANFAKHAVHEDERQAIFAHPSFSTHVLTMLAKSVLTAKHRIEILEHDQIRMVNLLELAKTVTDPVERERIRTHRYTSERYVRNELARIYTAPLGRNVALAENPSTPQDQLDSIAEHAMHALERCALLKNPTTSANALDYLAKKVTYPAERLAMANHSNTSGHALALLSHQLLYLEEIAAIAVHPNADENTRQAMLKRLPSNRDRAYVQLKINRMLNNNSSD